MNDKERRRTYKIWCGIKDRCSNPRTRIFRHYGGKGIFLCARWQKFENFLADMGVCPSGLEIDRIDNSKGYEPGNCRWATRQQQCRNYSRNVLLSFRGETKTMIEWSEILSLPYHTLKKRVQAYGWSVDRALTSPVRQHKVYEFT